MSETTLKRVSDSAETDRIFEGDLDERSPLFFSMLCLIAVGVNAQNWPQFGGPERGSRDAAVVTRGESLNTRWNCNPGLVSSPVVWGKQGFVTTA